MCSTEKEYYKKQNAPWKDWIVNPYNINITNNIVSDFRKVVIPYRVVRSTSLVFRALPSRKYQMHNSTYPQKCYRSQ